MRSGLLFFGLLTCSILLVVGLRQWGQMTPAPQVIATDCALPCWNGFAVGYDSPARVEARQAVVEAMPDNPFLMTPVFDARPALARVQVVVLPSDDLRLGDLLLRYGVPQTVRVERTGSQTRMLGSRQLVTEIRLYWVNDQLMATATQPIFQIASHITPDMPIREIVVSAAGTASYTTSGRRLWRGFGNALRYELSDK